MQLESDRSYDLSQDSPREQCEKPVKKHSLARSLWMNGRAMDV